MTREKNRTAHLVIPLLNFAALLFGALVGWVAWPHAIWAAPLALVAIPFFGNTRAPMSAPFLLMFGYHLATTWGLIHGTAVFFPKAGLLLGGLFWLGSSMVFAAPYLLYHRISRWFRGALGRLSAALVATLILSALSTILPPLGIIGWTSPWIGALNSGWPGVLATLASICLAAFVEDGLILAVLTLPPILLASAPTPVPAPHEWTGLSTRFGHLSSPLSYVQASMRLERQTMQKLRDGAKVILLPETVAGPWYAGTKAIWRTVIHWTATHRKQAVFVGAFVPEGIGYVDAMVQISDGRTRILPDHIPVPFSMWHPWQPRGSFRMRVFGKPEMTRVGQTRVGYLVCYEQLLMLPGLQLAWHHPQALLAPANDWWARGTDIPAIQRASVEAWGRLLHVSVITAVNS